MARGMYRLGDVGEVTGTTQQAPGPTGVRYVIWVEESAYQYNCDREVLASLSETGEMTPIFEGEDGVIYRVADD